jgi:hypothetical protein
MNAGKVVWLWQVSGGAQWRGVTDTFGQAQQDAETCMDMGGKAAVVESVLFTYHAHTMQREYAPTGRRCTVSRVGGCVQWTKLAAQTAEPA